MSGEEGFVSVPQRSNGKEGEEGEAKNLDPSSMLTLSGKGTGKAAGTGVQAGLDTSLNPTAMLSNLAVERLL